MTCGRDADDVKTVWRVEWHPARATVCLQVLRGAKMSAPGRIRTRHPLLRRSVCAAGQPACPQVSRCTGLSGSDRKFPVLTGRSDTPGHGGLFVRNLAAPVGVRSVSLIFYESSIAVP